ncbi:hypothetical protein HBI56_219130 [Parastagonospora nodorum]|uniref:Uncharacterized protein n=2 Tax=Phaeosphaeria nodorum (strain SN15 / ATCC MYA-4574 / FGSC 10173) TaxID=321614 RepID=A0A7U2HVV7_PHANO|nr:hypothetical protein HBH56_007990 [Parastagonospora nodorum]QRC90571.1 hypothetical protein JI435_000890 [Parastagonospora nodorum SN15]KAH3922105.1 hypothetical protein HBH54_227820 [Parastagonospora nodorum]KAH3960004.1 hypothetical protein HBH52_239770 [Parastagonospora nodorum]KAH3991476.1 hypothetical protein HBI10_231020 [Parastagonospora nodorum]
MADQTFNWAGLPTELKERIAQCCAYQPLEQGDYRQRLSRWFDRRRPRDTRREFGIYEIIDKLTDWASLLGVSHQVRAITLRLCFVYYGGLSLMASSCRSLASSLDRLGRYYQMMDDNGLPMDDRTKALADNYRNHPRIYPQLEQYATFRHGLRSIYLSMDFIAYMHFFKVSVGSFKQYLLPGSISYEIFEELPNLNQITFRLPRKPQQGWRDMPEQPGPPLFFPDFPCPRILHRLIYDCIAAVLTLYPLVEVNGFIDADEKDRYESLRAAAIQDREWSPDELAELYTECGGGVKLEEPVQPGSWLVEDGEEEQNESISRQAPESMAGQAHDEKPEDDFFPPKCRCAEQCSQVFYEKEKKRRIYRVTGGGYY